jgi:hypothetical protein
MYIGYKVGDPMVQIKIVNINIYWYKARISYDDGDVTNSLEFSIRAADHLHLLYVLVRPQAMLLPQST